MPLLLHKNIDSLHQCMRKKAREKSSKSLGIPLPKVNRNQLLPQDVESLCTYSALTYLHSIAGPGYYLILLPDSQVEAEVQFASGITRSWQWTHNSISLFVCFCLRN